MDSKQIFATLASQLVLDIRDEINPFSSGSVGYFAGGKVVLDNTRYQVSLSIVEVGSKGRFKPKTK